METCQHHALVKLYHTTPPASVSEKQRMEFTVYCSEQLMKILQYIIYCIAEVNRLFK